MTDIPLIRKGLWLIRTIGDRSLKEELVLVNAEAVVAISEATILRLSSESSKWDQGIQHHWSKKWLNNESSWSTIELDHKEIKSRNVLISMKKIVNKHECSF